jgi:Mg-chelatase subunit ChlD
MKKLCILGLLVFGYGALGSAQQRIEDYIDEAVFKAARYLEDRLPSKARIAIFNNPSQEVEEAVFHTLESNLVNGDKLDMLERNETILHLINKELDFQHSGKVSDDSLKSLDKLGAQYIVLIWVEPQGGSLYDFWVKAVNVKTTKIMASSKEYRFQRQVAIQSQVMVDYRLIQRTYDGIASNRTYLKLGFRIHSEINIENLPKEIIDSAPSFQGKRKNICFVIDISGSMDELMMDRETKKIKWVKREIQNFFKKNIGEHDIISVVIFDDQSDEIIRSKRIENKADIEWCISTIEEKLYSRGGTIITPGLKKGYELVRVNKNDDYINCVILFTDGESNEASDKEAVKELVAKKKNEDITTISTVALSTSSKAFMTEVAEIGRGLSLFVDSNNAARSMENELALLANATLKNKEYQLGIKLSAHEGVIFKYVSDARWNRNHDLAYYTFNIREGEEKFIEVTAVLGENALQSESGGILDIDITSNTLLTSKHQVFLTSPTYSHAYKKTRVLETWHQ